MNVTGKEEEDDHPHKEGRHLEGGRHGGLESVVPGLLSAWIWWMSEAQESGFASDRSIDRLD